MNELCEKLPASLKSLEDRIQEGKTLAEESAQKSEPLIALLDWYRGQRGGQL